VVLNKGEYGIVTISIPDFNSHSYLDIRYTITKSIYDSDIIFLIF